MAAEGGILSGLWYIFRGKTPAEEGDGQPGDFEDAGDASAPDGDGRAIGGDPSQGYYQTTPPGGVEPPMSTTGKSYYEHNRLTGRSTDPRGQDEPPDPGGTDGWGNRY